MIHDRAVVGEASVVIETALRAHEQARERRRAVHPVGRAARLEIVDADLGGTMHRPSRLAEERRHVARRATPASFEDRLPARGRGRIERPGFRFRRRDRELVVVQARELGGDEVLRGARVPRSGFRGHRIFRRVVQPRIEVHARAVHLRDGDVGVPVRHRSPAVVGVQVDACEPERGRNHGRAALAVGPCGLSVLVELGVVLAGAPAIQHLHDGRLIDAEKVLEGLQARRDGDNGADIEIAIGPAVEAPADAMGERIVHGRMTESAGDADRAHGLAIGVEERLHADDRVRAQELDRRVHFLEAHVPAANRLAEDARQLRDVDLEAELQRLVRRDARPDAAVRASRDRAMQLQLAAPECLAPERVGAEDLTPFLQHALGVLADVVRPGFDVALLRRDGRIGVDVARKVEATRHGQHRGGRRRNEEKSTHGNLLLSCAQRTFGVPTSTPTPAS